MAGTGGWQRAAGRFGETDCAVRPAAQMGGGDFGVMGAAHVRIQVAAGGDLYWGGITGETVRQDDFANGALRFGEPPRGGVKYQFTGILSGDRGEGAYA